MPWFQSSRAQPRAPLNHPSTGTPSPSLRFSGCPFHSSPALFEYPSPCHRYRKITTTYSDERPTGGARRERQLKDHVVDMVDRVHDCRRIHFHEKLRAPSQQQEPSKLTHVLHRSVGRRVESSVDAKLQTQSFPLWKTEGKQKVTQHITPGKGAALLV